MGWGNRRPHEEDLRALQALGTFELRLVNSGRRVKVRLSMRAGTSKVSARRRSDEI